MPARPGHSHSEDLPWLEVSQPLPAAEKESDSGGGVVPPICGEAAFLEICLKSHTKINKWTDGSDALSVVNSPSSPFLSHSNKRNTSRSRAPPLWCSPTPEDGRCALCLK